MVNKLLFGEGVYKIKTKTATYIGLNVVCKSQSLNNHLSAEKRIVGARPLQILPVRFSSNYKNPREPFKNYLADFAR